MRHKTETTLENNTQYCTYFKNMQDLTIFSGHYFFVGHSYSAYGGWAIIRYWISLSVSWPASRLKIGGQGRWHRFSIGTPVLHHPDTFHDGLLCPVFDVISPPSLWFFLLISCRRCARERSMSTGFPPWLSAKSIWVYDFELPPLNFWVLTVIGTGQTLCNLDAIPRY